MKKLLFVLFLLTASYEGISAKKITKRFYGSEAVQSDVNPCAGPTIRVCGEIEIDEITGEQFVIICGGPGEVDVILAVEVDLKKDLATVLVDMDLDTLDETNSKTRRRFKRWDIW